MEHAEDNVSARQPLHQQQQQQQAMSVDNDNQQQKDPSAQEESTFLQDLLHPITIADFFEHYWQEKFVFLPQTAPAAVASPLYAEIGREGDNVLLQLHDAGRTTVKTGEQDEELPLHFVNQSIVPNVQSWYAAYLNGTSVVTNHVDTQHVWTAAVADNLQHSFPHVYANSYLTPPSTQTVPAHADDRDVFIVQLTGRKLWRLYEIIPIVAPYPDEQVGKTKECPVPLKVLSGPCQTFTLCPGDALYIPRGVVHEAQAITSTTDKKNNMASFHITLALATHDWSYASMVTQIAAKLWHAPGCFRHAIPRQVGCRRRIDADADESVVVVQDVLQVMQDELRQHLTVDNLASLARQKYNHHNGRAARKRQELYGSNNKTNNCRAVTGHEAARATHWTTRIRMATAAEKKVTQDQFLTRQRQQQPAGLQVREDSGDALQTLLGELRAAPVGTMWTVMELVQKCGNLDRLLVLVFCRQCIELGALARVV